MDLSESNVSNYYISLGNNGDLEEHQGLQVDGVRAKSLSASECPAKDSTVEARKKLILASMICGAFMLIELIAGIISNSLALMTDALHLVSDLSSFLISLFALWLSSLQGTRRLSFGYHRAEILGALFSVGCIWVLSSILFVEACRRMFKPVYIRGGVMFTTALLGTLANLFMTFILNSGCHHHHQHHTNNRTIDCSSPPVENKNSINSVSACDTDKNDTANACATLLSTGKVVTSDLEEALFHTGHRHFEAETKIEEPYSSMSENVTLRAAYIHALGDLIQNVGVLIAALVIWYKPEWAIFDPICTAIFCILVCFTTFSILCEATNVLMEGTPRELDVQGLKEDLLQIQNVLGVHDLHVWCLSVGKPSLACHMVIKSDSDAKNVLNKATRICQEKYGILHTTIQTDFTSNNVACDTDAHAKCH